MASNMKPLIFVLNLEVDEDYDGLFDAIYADLQQSLTSVYRVQRARKLDAASRYLSNPENKPVAILAVDPGVTRANKHSILSPIKTYVQNGGTVVFMGLFSSFIGPDDMNKFWKEDWGLMWEMGDYHRTGVSLNARSLVYGQAPLLPSYSQKAVFLKNVNATDSIYAPSSESRTQSHVFQAETVDQDQAPVAFTKIGSGWLGYIGDVNNEEGSQNVVLAMCKFAASRSM